MSTTYTVTAVSDWRVTVIEDRGDGHTTTWELPLAWVNGPIVGEPLRGVVFPAKVVQPVAWMYDFVHQGVTVKDWVSRDYAEAHSKKMGCHNIRPLYTAPQVAQPLTRDQVKAMTVDAGYGLESPACRAAFIDGIRRAELAHRIGQEGGAA